MNKNPSSPVGTEQKAMEEYMNLAIAAERELNDLKYAARVHAHPEVQKLEQRILKEVKSVEDRLIDPEQFAPHNHSHPQSLVPLDYVERGDQIRGLTDAELCPLHHNHPKTDQALQDLQSADKALLTAIQGFALKSEVTAVLEALQTLKEDLLLQLNQLSAKIPQLPKDEPELTAAKFCVIPHRCSGRRIKDMLAVDLEGKKVEAEVKHKDRVVQAGMTFQAGDLLVLPPNCLVLFRFY